MKKTFNIVATLAALTVAFGTITAAQALGPSDPITDPGGGIRGGPGAGDPSLGGTRMPPGGDGRNVDASERKAKEAERREKEAAQRKEEERKRREAEAAAAQARKNDQVKRALTPTSGLTRQSANVTQPYAGSASAGSGTTTSVPRRASLSAPSSLSR